MPVTEEEDARQRDRAYLVGVLLVGGIALTVGLFFLLTQGFTSAAGVFDAVIGVAILLVGWLFLGPMLAPSFFGDRTPEEAPVVRPYLRFPIVSPLAERASLEIRSAVDDTPATSRPPVPIPAASAPPAAKPVDQIPRWADSLVARSPDGGSSPIPAAPREPSLPPSAPPTSGDKDEEDAILAEIMAFAGPPEGSRHSVAPEPSSGSSAPVEAAPPPEMIRELDLISAELRGPKRKGAPWTPPPGVEGPRRARSVDSESGLGETGVQDDAWFEPL